MGTFIRENDTEKFNKLMIKSIISSILIGLIGLFMFLYPNLTNRLIGILVGTAMIICGINALYKFFKRNGAKLYSYNLLFGLILLIMGIVTIILPFSVTDFITICLGLFLIVNGCNKLTYGIWFKIGNDSSWLLTLVIGIMLMFFGIILIVNPFSSMTITKLLGTFLLLTSILEITDTIMLYRRSKEIVKIFW